MAGLTDRILAKTARVGVLGLGYVGLPLAVAFSRAGFTVLGFETDPDKVRMLAEGRSYIPDVSSAEVARSVDSGTLLPGRSFERIREADAVIVCVPTPLTKFKDPDVSHIVAAVEEIRRQAHPEMLVVLESTSYPGTTEELVKAVLEQDGYTVGRDIFVCYSPERVDPGNRTYRVENTPKVVGGITPACTAVGALLYSQIVEKVVPVSSTSVAEMAKIMENAFRSINIGLVNEFALLCQDMGVDVWEALAAAATKPFGYMPFSPGPGVGGHCIPSDPMYLAWKARGLNLSSRFIELASEINSHMPERVVRRVAEVLNLDGKSLSTSTILCLGLAYKRDSSDTRDSPCLEVIRLLQAQGAKVLCSDPCVPPSRFANLAGLNLPLTAEMVRAADCVVLLTDHSAFDYEFLAAHAQLVLDTRNAFQGVRRPGIFRLGAPLPGYGST